MREKTAIDANETHLPPALPECLQLPGGLSSPHRRRRRPPAGDVRLQARPVQSESAEVEDVLRVLHLLHGQVGDGLADGGEQHGVILGEVCCQALGVMLTVKLVQFNSKTCTEQLCVLHSISDSSCYEHHSFYLTG